MRPNSSPLAQELARSQQSFDAHPDSDQLAAFAEDALLLGERVGVLSHLAVCSRCREVLGVATAAALDGAPEASVEVVAQPGRRSLRRWLPWAAAAALAGTAIFLLPSPKTAPPVETSKTNPLPPPDKQAETSTDATGRPASANALDANARNKAAHGDAARLPPIAPAQPEQQLARSQSDAQVQTGQSFNYASTARPPAAVIPSRLDGEVSATKKASENVAAQASPALNAMLPENSSQQVVSAPAPVGGALATAPVSRQFTGFAARPQWRINERGQVERSFGGGSWQRVLDDGSSKLRVVSVMGSSVWAGGDGLRLYRSEDNGASWSSVHLPPKGSVASAITHVRFQTPLDGTIDASDGSSWVTTDGGITWK